LPRNRHDHFVSLNVRRADLGLPQFDLPLAESVFSPNPVAELVVTTAGGNTSSLPPPAAVWLREVTPPACAQSERLCYVVYSARVVLSTSGLPRVKKGRSPRRLGRPEQ
jgi:hypothetical protein